MIDKYTFGSDRYVRLSDHEALIFDMKMRIARLKKVNATNEEKSIMDFVDYVHTVNSDSRKVWLDRMAFQYINRLMENNDPN